MPGRTDALSLCVGDTDRFLRQSWGKRAHVRSSADVAGLLGVDDVDRIVSSMALRSPAFRLVKGGATLDPASYTRRARIGSRTVTDLIDVGRVYDQFSDGATIVLQGLHRYWPPVTDLCRDLEDALTHPVQANAYITPPVAQGLRVHADKHDVFALQTHGHKQWVVFEDGYEPDADHTPTLDTSLAPGDCLYLPKGMHHAARTIDSASIHLTLGVRTITWADVITNVLRDAGSQPSLDEALPAGFARHPEALADESMRRLSMVADVLRTSDAAQAVVETARAFRTQRPPVLTGQLRQLLAAGDISDHTLVQVRPRADCEVTRHGETVFVALGDRSLRMPAAAEPAVRAGLELQKFTPSDLGDHLDEAGRTTLVQRLVREGLLMVVDA